MLSDIILASREERRERINQCLLDYESIISIKANIPGNDKKLNLSYFLVRLFGMRVWSKAMESIQFHDGLDGPYFLFATNQVDAATLKQQTIDIEESSALGRYIDIDVYHQTGQISRTVPRKCILCDEYAHDCIRNQRHEVAEVLAKMEADVFDYLNDLIGTAAQTAIIEELDLDPKFGLVTKTSQGSHPDMDYALMRSAIDAILPHLKAMFLVGFRARTLTGVFQEIRKIGLSAEKAMLETTHQVNAYKGLIFSLGIVLAASGYSLGNGLEFIDIFRVIPNMVGNLVLELESDRDTFGKEAFHRYGFTGARGEAQKGFPNVITAMKELKDFSIESKYKALISLIIHSEDTVFLKRAGSYSRYQVFLDMFRNIDDYSIDNLSKMTKICINEHLSFGGAADLLVVSLFLKRVRLLMFSATDFYPSKNEPLKE